MKKALITGITGQDGAYMAEYLLNKGYEVHGIKRRASSFNTERIDHIYQDPHDKGARLKLHYGDLTDSTNLIRLIQEIQPDEIYNLGAMSHVRVSFEMPEYVANTDAIGTLRILEAVRLLGLTEKCRIYQASTSELYGKVQAIPQSETTPFYPRSPYAVAKLYGYWITVNYREAYNMYACNGVLFNHESPLRGETFVSRRAFGRVLAVLIPTIVFIGLIGYLGLYVASAIFIAAFMLFFGRQNPLKAVAVGAGVPFALFMLFEKWFLVPLPKGPLEAWLGY